MAFCALCSDMVFSCVQGAVTPKASMVSLRPNDVIFKGSKQYSSTYPFWQVKGPLHLDVCNNYACLWSAQLIDWFNAGTDQDSSEPDLFGTCLLPTPSECFGPSESDYTPVHREALQAHLNSDQSQAMSWPKLLKGCFSTNQPHGEVNMLIGSPVLDVGLGRVDAVGACLDEMFGADRLRVNEDFTQFDNNLPPEMPSEWVQCELCFKWRRVPFHVILDDLPDYWTCSMNFWDESDKANCEAPQDAYDPEKESTVDGVTRNYRDEPCQEGDWKDVFCIRNCIYYEAQVQKIRTGKNGKLEAKFHFKGWKPSQDEWIEIGSDRIAPYHLYTNATACRVRDQEKWQGYKSINHTSSTKISKKRSSNSKSASKAKNKKTRPSK